MRHPKTGKYRRTRLFVMTLGYSRKAVRLLRFRSSSRIWAELHETAFRRLGGSPRCIVLDNLREGVIVPDFYDPTLNPLFKDVLAHYGVVALPCRGSGSRSKREGRGRRRSCPENPAEGSPLRESGRGAGPSGPMGNPLGRYAHTRHDQAAGRRHVRRREAVTAPTAGGTVPLLPITGTASSIWTVAGKWRLPYYGLPPGWIGRTVKVQWDTLHVRILDPETHQLLREHVGQKRGGYRVRPEDNPKKTPWTTVQLLARAARAGSHIGELAKAIHRRQGEAAIRPILGLFSLGQKIRCLGRRGCRGRCTRTPRP